MGSRVIVLSLEMQLGGHSRIVDFGHLNVLPFGIKDPPGGQGEPRATLGGFQSYFGLGGSNWFQILLRPGGCQGRAIIVGVVIVAVVVVVIVVLVL